MYNLGYNYKVNLITPQKLCPGCYQEERQMIYVNAVLASKVSSQMKYNTALNLVFELQDKTTLRSLVFDNSWLAEKAANVPQGADVAFRGWRSPNTDVIDLTYLNFKAAE